MVVVLDERISIGGDVGCHVWRLDADVRCLVCIWPNVGSKFVVMDVSSSV